MPLHSQYLIRAVTPLMAALALTVGVAVPAQAEPSAADLSRQLTEATRQLDLVVEAYNQATDRLAGLQRSATDLAAQLAPVQAAADRAGAALGTVAAGMYERGVTASLEAVLSATSPSSAVDRLATANVLAWQQDRELTAYQRAAADLNRELDAVALVTAQVRNQQAGLAVQRVTVQSKIDKLRDLRRKVYGSDAASPPRADGYVPAYQAGPAGQAVRYAFAQIGKGYRYGADGPDSYDCSGLVMASWRSAGVSLDHSAASQWRQVTHLSRGQLLPGDLVFYYSDIHHVALYIGGGRVVHAPTWGHTVTTAPIDIDPVHGYGRVHA